MKLKHQVLCYPQPYRSGWATASTYPESRPQSQWTPPRSLLIGQQCHHEDQGPRHGLSACLLQGQLGLQRGQKGGTEEALRKSIKGDYLTQFFPLALSFARRLKLQARSSLHTGCPHSHCYVNNIMQCGCFRSWGAQGCHSSNTFLLVCSSAHDLRYAGPSRV